MSPPIPVDRRRSLPASPHFAKAGRPVLIGLGLAALLAGVTTAPILAGAELPRNALWAVVRSCVTIDAWAGTPFPCISVRSGPQGFAVLRAPGRRTHLIVTPTARLSGLESPALVASGAAYWQAALDARSLVADAAGRLPLGDIALSVNARRSRSQDQFHIHVECANPQVLKQVRSQAPAIGPGWTRLSDLIDGSAYWARHVQPGDPAARNALAVLRALPGSLDPAQVVLGAVNLSEDGSGEVIQLVSGESTSAAEDMLDLSCAAAQRSNTSSKN